MIARVLFELSGQACLTLLILNSQIDPHGSAASLPSFPKITKIT